MVGIGDVAPDFSLPDQNGHVVSLSGFRGRPVVLYFYPRAMTPGCTREAQGFQSHEPDLTAHRVAVLGISVDSTDRQKEFSDRCHLAFPLLSDTQRSVAKAYGVLGIFGMAKRVTFLLDPEGKVVDVVVGMRPGPHVEAAMRRFASPPA